MALQGRRFVQQHEEACASHGAMFADGQVSRAISLTQARVDNVVASHLRASDVVSLKGLRLTLERQVGVCLETRKAEIKSMAVQAVDNFADGFGIMKLPCALVASLRDPYRGVWEPCRRAAVVGTATATLPTRGRMLFTELCDYLDSHFDDKENNYSASQQDGPAGKICCSSIQNRDPREGMWEPCCRTQVAGTAARATRGRLPFSGNGNENNYTSGQQDGPIGKICCYNIQRDSNKVRSKKVCSKSRSWDVRLGRSAVMASNGVAFQHFLQISALLAKFLAGFRVIDTTLPTPLSTLDSKPHFCGLSDRAHSW